MKYPTKYRYVVWSARGGCSSCNTAQLRPSGTQWNYINPTKEMRACGEEQLVGYCPGEWDSTMLDMEKEEDRKYIECILKL